MIKIDTKANQTPSPIAFDDESPFGPNESRDEDSNNEANQDSMNREVNQVD